MEEAYKRHKEELEIQQLQHFQTFRNYREVFEEQKSAIEQRYRTLLEEAIQDAVFLSTRNQELMHENQALKQGNWGIRGHDSICSKGIERFQRRNNDHVPLHDNTTATLASKIIV